MTAPTVDNLFFEVDEFVTKMENAGFDISEVVDVLSEYVEIVTEYL
jgi:hypothetical protein